MMRKGAKNPHTVEWNRKISEGVKKQHAEGRGRSIGFTDEQRRKAVEKNWKGQNASMPAIHAWVTRGKGRPSKCEDCGTTTAKKFEWSNIDHKYRRVLSDYIRRCTSCHRKYDYGRN